MFNFFELNLSDPFSEIKNPAQVILSDHEDGFRHENPIIWCKEVFKPKIPYAQWHEDLLHWFSKQTNAIFVASRGSAKTSITQQGIIWALLHDHVETVLYVSGTQAQADLHVEAILSELEKLGIKRLENQYGNSRGYRKGFIRTDHGNVIAIGLDKGIRGVKLDTSRPDLIVLDDCESSSDTRATTFKKQQAITKAILPSGSSKCRILFIQNKILKNGLVSKLQSPNPPFLYDADLHVIPALLNFSHKIETINNRNRVVISGEPTWVGMPLETCQKFVDERGLEAFLNESQHEFENNSGQFFKADQLREATSIPEGLTYSRGWDFAATEGAGDYTATILVGEKDGLYYILDFKKFQYSSEKVEKHFKETLASDEKLSDDVITYIPQDPGSSGKAYANILKSFGPGIITFTQNTNKATRAKIAQRHINEGNVFVSPEIIENLKEELEEFREDGSHIFDDAVDALSAAFMRFSEKRNWWSV